MGLVNAVVPHDQLDVEVDAWCAEIMGKSPTALALAKRSFNIDSESIRAIGAFGFEALGLYYAPTRPRKASTPSRRNGRRSSGSM